MTTRRRSKRNHGPNRGAMIVGAVAVPLILGTAGRGFAQGSSPSIADTSDARPQEMQIVAPEVELRWSSTGRLLGTLIRGVTVERLGGRAGWTRIGVRGWMETTGMQETGGERAVGSGRAELRDASGGAVIGSLQPGTRVRRVAGGDGWSQVELIAWVHDSAVESVTAAPPPTPAGPIDEEGQETTAREAMAGSDPADSVVGRLTDRVALRSAPEGETVSTLPEGVFVEAVETRGGWTRVELEGWIPSGSFEARATSGSLTPQAVAAADAGAYIGRTVHWMLEHVALQRADEWRPDFAPGEVFDLTRVPDDRGRYVYLAVPADLIDTFRSLSPFQIVRVEGRVRTGRSTLTGSVILDVTGVDR